MRALPLLLILIAGPVYAGGFGELGGGVMLPVANDDWTNIVDSSPKLFVRGGFIQDRFGGMLSLDYTPTNNDADGAWGGLVRVTSYRFRLLANVVAHMDVGKQLVAAARFGLGLDYQQYTASSPLGEVTRSSSGLGLEPGIGLWYQAAPSVAIGAEIALPISFHEWNDIPDYTALDIDILLGVRISGSR